MLEIKPVDGALGARILGIDLNDPLDDATFEAVRAALGQYGVLCFPGQNLEPAPHKAIASRLGSLETNVATGFSVEGHPEVMILSNMVQGGRPIGLADAGQGWHTDMSYNAVISIANMLFAVEAPPPANGRPVGDTEFSNMHAAYDDLPDAFKTRLAGATAEHDFNKFWEMMRERKGSPRPPLTPEQRRKKPPAHHPIFMDHPITGRKVLYANPGYAVRIDGFAQDESDSLLAFLFEHQLQPKYRYAHHWTKGDVLLWDNIGTIHNAVADYGPDQHRCMRRCQVMADKAFERAAAIAAQ